MHNINHNSIRLLFLADTHLGFDAAIRPRVQRRRRGDDFYQNYLTALQPAFARKVDLVLHGGDMFFRSRVHPLVVQAAFAPLLRIADLGIPVFIIPGNHERSNIPRSLLENHPNIFIFEKPHTHVMTLHGFRLAISGFANIRENPRFFFKQRLQETGWRNHEADLRLLGMHQTVEGAQVGVQNYTFRSGEQVIRGCDIPADFNAVLSGHIHRYQVLIRDLSGRLLDAPVFYPGSTERTSFAERKEEKGYLLLTVHPTLGKRIEHQFVVLQTRPMIDLMVEIRGATLEQIREKLQRQIAALDENAIVRVHTHDTDADRVLSMLNDRWLRSVAPKSVNIGWAFRRRREQEDSNSR